MRRKEARNTCSNFLVELLDWLYKEHNLSLCSPNLEGENGDYDPTLQTHEQLVEEFMQYYTSTSKEGKNKK